MQITKEKKRDILWTMILSRRFEEKLAGLCAQKDTIPGMMILATGQEAVGAGICAALTPDDIIITNHRSHHHLLAKGADPKALMAEIFGKSTGCNKGKSGTLHLAVPEINAPCTSTVVGAGLPIAVGTAFAQRYEKKQNVTVCFFGDGAADEGSFHESLNLASLWNLPVVFVCENNIYAGAQRYEEHTRVPNVADRAAAYAMPGEIVDGNDALAVYDAAVRARHRAIAGDGPTLLECKTYRCRGHGEADPQLYQPKEEIAAWKEKCPISRLQSALLRQEELRPEDVDRLESRAETLVEEAVRFAEHSPYPAPEDALEHVLAP